MIALIDKDGPLCFLSSTSKIPEDLEFVSIEIFDDDLVDDDGFVFYISIKIDMFEEDIITIPKVVVTRNHQENFKWISENINEEFFRNWYNDVRAQVKTLKHVDPELVELLEEIDDYTEAIYGFEVVNGILQLNHVY